MLAEGPFFIRLWAVPGMFRRLLTFRTRQQPLMVRLSYNYEMRSALTYPLAASLAEGTFTGIVAAKYFSASQLVIAFITAAPMFGNILALMWAELSRNRHKVPFVNALQAGVVISVGLVATTAFMPLDIGAWLFAAMIIAARLLASGIVTVRSVIWRANYPRNIRGQIIGRITVASTAMLLLSTVVGGFWLDKNPRAFMYFYPAAAMLGVIGIWQFSHIRVRREGQDLRRQQLIYTPQAEGVSQSDETNLLNYAPVRRTGFRVFFADAFEVLRQDKAFRTYQRYQFISGFSFMMFATPVLHMVSTEMTDPSREYLLANFVLQIIPMVVTIIATQLWAPLFDRVHITVFRVAQTLVSVIAQATLFVGAIVGISDPDLGLWIIGFAYVLIGISTGGGQLAWNLGHNDFAPADKAATYMGVHVMLTGLRGCLAPFIGAWLYQAFLGRYIFALCTACCIVALLGFTSMARTAPFSHAARPSASGKRKPARV